MEINLYDGKKEVVLRGEDGNFELCEWKNVKKDGKAIPTLCPYLWYSSLQSALSRFVEIKLSNSDASTLAELQNELVKVRKEIVSVYEL